jgi:hypothetical protein
MNLKAEVKRLCDMKCYVVQDFICARGAMWKTKNKYLVR